MFKKKLLNIKCVSWFFSTTSVWNVSHSKKNWVRYDQKCILFFMWSTCYSCRIVRTCFRKILTYMIWWKSVQWEPSFTMQTGRWTDGQTDMTKPVVAFCNFVNARKKFACPCPNCGLYLSQPACFPLGKQNRLVRSPWYLHRQMLCHSAQHQCHTS